MRSRPAAPRRAAGFTLLEAIVALVLVGGMGAAMLSWINNNLIAVSRVREVNLRNEVLANALEYMQTVNPMLTPTGRNTLGAYRLEWKAAPVGDVQNGVGYPSGSSLYQLALYKTHVRVSTEVDPEWMEFDLKLVGYKGSAPPPAFLP